MDVRRLPGVRPAALLYLLAALLCTQIPLLNYLGYESSLLMALLGSLFSGALSISWTRVFLREEGERREGGRLLTFARESLLHNLLLAAVPLVVLLSNAFFVKNCSLVEGMAFYLLLPLVSVAFSVCLGIFCALHYRHARLAFVGFLLASFAYALALGYFTPAIFSYNFFYGYFPGLTYDEILEITLPLVLFRALTLAFAAFLLWLSVLLFTRCQTEVPAWKRGLHLLAVVAEPRNRVLTLCAVLAAALLYVFRCTLGFESTASFIRHELGGELRTAHFVIYYPGSSFTREELARIAREHEFQLDRILREFALQNMAPIESYIYPNAKIKQRLIGAGMTNIAKPWNNQVHIVQSSLGAALKHELIHVVAGRFGLPLIRASLSTGLVEGLAMAMDEPVGTRTLHQYTAALRHYDLLPDITGLMDITGFASQSGAVSYTVAGSFCRYLIDRYGIRTLTQVYGSGSYERAFGRSLRELVGEWHSYLDRVAVRESDRAAVDVLFRSPPIFRRVCARVIAGRNAEARLAFREKHYGAARDLFLSSYTDAGGYEAMAGHLTSLFRLGEYGSVVELGRHYREGLSRPLELLPLYVMLGDACWATGDTSAADSFYAVTVDADLSEGSAENALLRQRARATPGGESFLRYFLMDPADSSRRELADSMSNAFPGSVLWAYLTGRELEREGKDDRSLNVLAGVSLAEASPRLEAIRRMSLGGSLFRLNRLEEAKVQFWLSLNYYRTEAAWLAVEEWIDRCEWMKAHAGE
jgi:hypothetical protein